MADIKNYNTANPWVSFCLSTYKRAGFLKDTLDIIKTQTFPHFEVVVSDNDPEQSARIVVEGMNDPRFKYFANIDNLGMIKSFNKSIERSTGEYIVMMADDDPPYPTMIETIYELAQKYPAYGMYSGCGDWIIGNEYAAQTLKLDIGVHSKLLPGSKENDIIIIEKNDFVKKLVYGNFSRTFLLWSCAVVRKDILVNINGVPDYGSELLGDFAYIITLSSQQGMVFINKAVGGQYIHGKNFGYEFSAVRQKYINTPTSFFKYIESKLSKNDNWPETEKLIWTFIGRGWVEYSLMLFHSFKDNKEGKKDFFKAFNEVFSNKKLTKWKYKFYMKAYFIGLFNVLIKVKQSFVKNEK
jgi:glycosyltransferase involved in cell wall biosynthesis